MGSVPGQAGWSSELPHLMKDDPVHGGALDWVIFEGPFNLNHPVILQGVALWVLTPASRRRTGCGLGRRGQAALPCVNPRLAQHPLPSPAFPGSVSLQATCSPVRFQSFERPVL